MNIAVKVLSRILLALLLSISPLLAACGNAQSQSDAQTTSDNATSADTESREVNDVSLIIDGGDVSESNFEFNLDKAEWVEGRVNIFTSDGYEYGEPISDGSSALVLTGTCKNLENDKVGYNRFHASAQVVTVDNKYYNYDSELAFANDVSNQTEISPLETDTLIVYTIIPNELREQFDYSHILIEMSKQDSMQEALWGHTVNVYTEKSEN